MNGTGPYYNPTQINTKIRDMLLKGDTTELPALIQEILLQSIANPLSQAIMTPLAQSLAAPLSQYFNNQAANSIKSEPVVQDNPAAELSNRLDPQLFEIHDFIVIRTAVPEDVDEKTIKVLTTTSHVTIKGDPSGNDHIIPLPHGAKKEGTTAAFKDRVLEIRIPKENKISPPEEINLDYL